MISSLYRTSIYFLVLVIVGNISAFKTFQERLPNGDSVPHPCHPNYLWPGVGHKNRDGGGTLNPFGEDFRSNGYVSIRWCGSTAASIIQSVVCATQMSGTNHIGDIYMEYFTLNQYRKKRVFLKLIREKRETFYPIFHSLCIHCF